MKKDTFILVNPAIHFQKPLSYGMYPNTAVMILATILSQKGFRVIVFDGKYRTMEESIRQLNELIDARTMGIGFSVMTVQLPWAYRVSQALKAAHPRLPVVWGGVHPTLFPEQTVEDPAVDAVVINDAAATIPLLAHALSTGDELESVPGVAFKRGKRIIRTPANTTPDTFENIPDIDFSLIDHQRYCRTNNIAIEEFYAGAYDRCKVYPVITSLSCTYRCTFCINVILERRYCARSAEEIVERIRFLKKEFNADFIHPLDENFFINRKRTFAFLEMLEKDNLNVKWRPQVRADYFCDSYIDLKTARRLDRAGMIVAAMGVESASQEILDMLKKQMRVEQIIKAMEILSRTNIVPKMNFMVGLPGESPEQIKQTYRLAVRLRTMAKKSCVTISPFRPYPGSPLYEKIVAEYGYRPPQSLAEWTHLSETEFDEGRGYESFKNYRWIENPKRLLSMQRVYEGISWYQPSSSDTLYGRIRQAIAIRRFRSDNFSWIFLEAYLFSLLSRGLRLFRKLRRAIRR